ncbi:MAG: hypothetical protein NT001_00980 [Candidatus Woesearchaeota archaeon]|nr:hypothetical protein [Candidatus Woesearchaeota archaeon]
MADIDEKKPDDDIQSYGSVNNKYVIYTILLVAILAGFFLLISQFKPVTFAVYDPTKTDYYLNNLNEAQAKYNEKSDSIPSTLRYIFGDEKINVTLMRTSGEKVNLAVETHNGKISNIARGEMKNPTMEVEMKETTIKKISESKNAIWEIDNALNSKEIKYKDLTVKSKIKMVFARSAIKVWSWFS